MHISTPSAGMTCTLARTMPPDHLPPPAPPPAPAHTTGGAGSSTDQTGAGSSTDPPPAPPEATRLPMVVLLRCPNCPEQVDGTRRAFDLNTIDYRTWCRRCKRSRFVRLWRCQCGMPWHLCPTHSGEPARLRSNTEASSTTAVAADNTRRTTSTCMPGVRSIQQSNEYSFNSWMDAPPNKHNEVVTISSTSVIQRPG